MIVLLKYRNKYGTVSEVEAVSTLDTTYSKKYKEGRVVSSFFAPEVITDTWNGKESDIQHVKWDVYKFQFNAKESEAVDISSFKSSSDLQIIQYNDNGNTTYTADTQKADYIAIEEPENVGNTSASTYIITFRTNRTIINKGNAVEYTNNIQFKKDDQWELLFESKIPADLYGEITSLNPETIAYLYPGSLTRYKRDGNSWVQFGDILAITGFGNFNAITTLDENTVAVMGDGDGLLATYSISSGVWAQVGNTLNLPGSYLHPTISAMTSSRIAIFDELYANLAAYDWDGSDWTLAGTPFSITPTQFVRISAMTSSRIGFIDAFSGQLRAYDFDDVNWTIYAAYNTPDTGTHAIVSLDSSTVAIISDVAEDIASYTLTTIWTRSPGALILDNVSLTKATYINSNEIYITGNVGFSGNYPYGNYSYGANTYYTDYAVVDYNRDTEDILVPWSDGTQKKAQKIDNSGIEYLQYLTTDKHDDFLKQLKESVSIFINGIEVSEVIPAKTQIGEDYYKITVSGITSTSTTIIDLGVNQTNKLELLPLVTPYYTDYLLTEVSRDIESLIIDWFDGTKKKAQVIDKPSIAYTLFLDNGELNEFVTAFKVSTSVEINDSVVTEENYTVEVVTSTLNKIVLTAIQSTTVTTSNLSPSNTYNITVTDGAGVHVFYTDYAPELTSETPEIDSVQNQTGVNSTVKSLSKQVVAVKLYLNEANAFSLKAKFEEKSSAKTYYNGSSSIPVLEERDVSPEKIGVDLYEVVCNCLVDVLST